MFRLKDKGYTTKCAVTQHDYEYAEDEIIQLQKATRGNKGGINLVFVGDGFNAEDIANGTYLKTIKEEVEHFFGVEPYTTYRDYFNVYTGDGFNAEDIANGTYLKTIKEEVEHFFGVEPYTTYRDYFNVYTAIPVSVESGIGTLNTIRYTKFETTFTGGGLKCVEPYTTYRDYFNVYTAIPVSVESGIGTLNTIRYTKFETTFTGGGLKCNSSAVFDYALQMPTVTRENLKESLVVLIPNTGDYGGITEMYADGSAIARV